MNQNRDTENFWARIHRQGLRPADSDLLGSSAIRTSLGWVLSLAILVLVANLPIYPRQLSIGWLQTWPERQIELVPAPSDRGDDNASSSPVTAFTQPAKIEYPLPDVKEKKKAVELPPAEEIIRPQKLAKIDRGPILEYVDESPAIVGGLSTLYLSIDYPKIARDQGIQGLTVLMFVVEKDGSTRDVEVFKPLHPALDSAAVAAVRKTLFKPGRQDGKIVRVKMRLPIRFKLIKQEDAAKIDTLELPVQNP
ncbi:MAG: energy transducer TonB [Bacteroidota bacterium]